MATWTTQATAIAGSVLTAAFWNTYVRDDSTFLYDAAVRNQIAGVPHYFGGSAIAPTTNAAYPSGSSSDKLAPDSDLLVLPSGTPDGTFKLEAVLATDGGGTVTLALVNLTDAPDTPVVEISSTSATGARQQSSSVSLTASKTYGVKVKVGAGNGWAWGIRLARTA